MKNFKTHILIGVITIGFLSFGCAVLPPARIADSDIPPVVVAPEKSERHKSIHPDAFEYEGILDIAVIVNGDWGDPVWTNKAYMPTMIELYYKNPQIGGEPQYAGIAGGAGGIQGYYYMLGDKAYAFMFDRVEHCFMAVTPTIDGYKQMMEDFATAAGHYRKKGT